MKVPCARVDLEIGPIYRISRQNLASELFSGLVSIKDAYLTNLWSAMAALGDAVSGEMSCIIYFNVVPTNRVCLNVKPAYLVKVPVCYRSSYESAGACCG